jgi:hypothetical protein
MNNERNRAWLGFSCPVGRARRGRGDGKSRGTLGAAIWPSLHARPLWHGHCAARGIDGLRLTPRRGVRSLGRVEYSRTLGPPRIVQGPYAGGIGGRRVARPATTCMARERARRQGARFYFICAASKMHNSLKCKLTSKSPKSKVVEEI